MRAFPPGGRPTVWGARTTATNSTATGSTSTSAGCSSTSSSRSRRASAGPCSSRTTRRCGRSSSGRITDFLTQRLARRRACSAARPKDAFYVRIDEALNPPATGRSAACTSRSASGPSYPAEFIVVRIGIWDGGAQVERSRRPEQEGRTMAPTATRIDPYANFNFRVEIDGITPRRLSRSAAGSTRRSTSSSTARAATTSRTRKLPGQTKYANIALKWGIDRRPRALRLAPAMRRTATVERKNGSIVVLDRQGNEKVRWNFIDAWPAKWTGPSLNAKGNDVAIETLELAHEGIERVSADVPDRARVHAAARLPRRRRHAAPRRRRCGWRRPPTRSCRCKDPRVQQNPAYLIGDPAVARRHAARRVEHDHAADDRGPVRGRPRVPAGPLQRDQPARRTRTPVRCARSASTTFEVERRLGGILGYPLDQLYEEVAFIAYHFHWPHDDVMGWSTSADAPGSRRFRRSTSA